MDRSGATTTAAGSDGEQCRVVRSIVLRFFSAKSDRQLFVHAAIPKLDRASPQNGRGNLAEFYFWKLAVKKKRCFLPLARTSHAERILFHSEPVPQLRFLAPKESGNFVVSFSTPSFSENRRTESALRRFRFYRTGFKDVTFLERGL